MDATFAGVPVPAGPLMAVLGLIVGSFLANVSVRLPLDEEVVVTPSHCRACERRLGPLQLVPVLSWLFQRGRCRACGAVVSWRYPAIELAAAAVGVWAAWQGTDYGAATLPAWLWIGATAVLGWQLLLIAVVDGEHYWLPDVLTWPMAVTGIAAATILGGGWPIDALVGVAVGFGLLWLVAFAYRRVRGRDGLGGGDPFLMGACGAWVGWMGLPSVLLWACAAAFSVVAARLIVRRRVRGDDRLPFGVFLAIGCWLTWLYGPIGL